VGIIAWSIPAFLVAIVLEFWWARRRRREVYRFADTVSDLNCGIGSQALSLPLFVVTVGFYDSVFSGYAQLQWSSGDWRLWVLAIVGLDFLYYWWHRASHESNILWAAHVVHHQSEDYNLAVALRQAYFTSLTSTLFYLPLAVLGVPTEVYLISNAISLLYQFWIHTELVDRLPAWYEWLFNTPSHHRVHHGINPQYLDRNHAAIFMLWDRLFGTFEPEVEPPVYGITEPLDSFNPLWANFHRLVELAQEAWGALRRGLIGQALWVWVSHPAWHPQLAEGEAQPAASPNGLSGRPKFDVVVGPGRMAVVGLSMALNVPLTMGLLLYAGQLDTLALASAIISLVVAGPSLAGVIEGRAWGATLEVLRAGVTAYALWKMLPLVG
jgi:sterol desaturase/sphingolipid hydroxylase (fatty acid hydroxylase superfamily)